jgi:very-short-patch-repair endonuclease
MTTPDVLSEIRRASRPYGVATDDDLRLTARQKQWACRTGALIRRHCGVYVDPAVPWSPMQDLAVAIAGGGHMASAWGRSAAAIWGLVDEHPTVPEIVVPRQRYARVDGAVVHRSSGLCWDDLMFRHHVRVTKPLITALDLGVILGPMDVAEVLVRARQLRLFEPDALRQTITRVAKQGRTGIRTGRAALELVMIGDRPADSVLELRFHHGPGQQLPPYEYQWKVRIRGKNLRIDFAYPAVKLAIEVDGYEKRKSRASLAADARRANLLVLDGWTIVRFAWEDVQFDPIRVASEILAALARVEYEFRR